MVSVLAVRKIYSSTRLRSPSRKQKKKSFNKSTKQEGTTRVWLPYCPQKCVLVSSHLSPYTQPKFFNTTSIRLHSYPALKHIEQLHADKLHQLRCILYFPLPVVVLRLVITSHLRLCIHHRLITALVKHYQETKTTAIISFPTHLPVIVANLITITSVCFGSAAIIN